MGELTGQREVALGERTVAIPKFKGLKGILAGVIIARIMRETPEVNEKVNGYAEKYAREHTVRLTPALAKMPRYAGLGLVIEDFGDDGFVELPDYPTPMALTLYGFPLLFDLARKEATRLVALIVVPNRELERADDENTVESLLDSIGKDLIREADLDQLLELVIAAGEVLDHQFEDQREALGKLMSRLPFLRGLTATTETSGEAGQLEPTESESSDESATSSTSSDASTDGRAERPSSVAATSAS